MLKKNVSVILVILLTLLLIAMVIRVFDKRIEAIEKAGHVQNVINRGMTHSEQLINNAGIDVPFRVQTLLN